MLHESCSIHTLLALATYRPKTTLQNLTATMIQDVADDFDVLEVSPSTVGGILDTLTLVSGSETPLTSDSQVGVAGFVMHILIFCYCRMANDFLAEISGTLKDLVCWDVCT